MQVTLINPIIAAVTAQVPVNLMNYPAAVLSAAGLAGAEEVDVFINSNGTWVATGQKLTVAAPTLVLQGGPTYAVTKDATVGAASVSVDFQAAY